MSNMIDPFEHASTPSVSFKNHPVGTSFTGTVTKGAELLQARDFDSGQPATWPDGNPKMAAVIKLTIDGTEHSIWATKPSAMYAAFTAARNKLGRTILPGDTLTVTYTGDEPNRDPRKNPAKQYAVTVVPGPGVTHADPLAPASTAPGTTFDQRAASPAPSFAQGAQPAPAQPAQPAPAPAQPAPAQPAPPSAPTSPAPTPGAAPTAQGEVGGFMSTLGAQADPTQLQAALGALTPEQRAALGL